MIPEKVQQVLNRHGLQATVFESGSTPTAPLAAQKLGVGVGHIAKSLLFVSKDRRFFLVVCPGNRKVSSAKLKQVIRVKTRMADAPETLQVTGFSPGGVCPFGIEGVTILLDKHLEDFDPIYPAAGSDSSGVAMSFQLLRKITGAVVFDLTEPLN